MHSSDKMTITANIARTKPRIDLTRPVLWLFAICLVVLIAMPLSWLAIYSFTDKTRHFTLTNFVTLVGIEIERAPL